jgi:hypothetical protein
MSGMSSSEWIDDLVRELTQLQAEEYKDNCSHAKVVTETYCTQCKHTVWKGERSWTDEYEFARHTTIRVQCIDETRKPILDQRYLVVKGEMREFLVYGYPVAGFNICVEEV